MKAPYVPSPWMRKLLDLEARYGRGQTYSKYDINQMLDKKLPEMLFRGRNFTRGQLSERCAKAIEHLSEASPAERERCRPRLEALLGEVEKWVGDG